MVCHCNSNILGASGSSNTAIKNALPNMKVDKPLVINKNTIVVRQPLIVLILFNNEINKFTQNPRGKK